MRAMNFTLITIPTEQDIWTHISPKTETFPDGYSLNSTSFYKRLVYATHDIGMDSKRETEITPCKILGLLTCKDDRFKKGFDEAKDTSSEG